MRRVRCPRCAATIVADGAHVTCPGCGLSGRVDQPAPPKAARDPWTFTVDLRRLAPTRWSRGLKGMAMLLIFAGVFAAGGVTGVAYERARSDIDALGNGLFGTNDGRTGAGDGLQAGLGDGTTTPPGTQAGTETQTDTGTQTGTDTGTQTGTDTGTQTGTDTGTQTQTQTGTQTQTQTGTSGQPGETLTWSFSGTGDFTSSTFQVPAGLVRFRLTYHGDAGFFDVQLIEPGQTRPAVRVASSDHGAVADMVRYASLAASGEYSLVVSAHEAGAWEVDVEAPRGESADSAMFSQGGNGDGGLGPFRFTDPMAVTFRTDAAKSFSVVAFDANGNEVSACTFRNVSGPTTRQGTCSAGGNIYFDIRIAKAAADKPWTLTATAA